MKKLLPSLIAVKKIESSIPRSQFSETDLDRAARLSLEVSGFINPIVVRRTSLQSFEVVDGHFEYYAAVSARRINPMQGETIAAFILEPENEKGLLEQVKSLRSGGNTTVITADRPSPDSTKAVLSEENPDGDRTAVGVAMDLTPVTEEIQQMKIAIQSLQQNLQYQLESLTRQVQRLQEKDAIAAVEKLLNERFPTIRQEVEPEKLEKPLALVVENYNRMTVSELKAIAKKSGISGYSSMRKAQLIAAIKRARGK